MMTTQVACGQTERELALLCLAATKTPRLGPCLPDEQLAAFIDGQLKKRERKRMLGHLASCSKCYYDWFEVASYMTETAPEISRGVVQTRSFTSLWGKLISSLPRLNFVIPATAAAALSLFVVFMWPGSNGLDNRIDDAYASLASVSMNDSGNRQGFSMPWESTVLSFDRHEYSSPTKAFGAGLVDGKTKLSGDADLSTDFMKSIAATNWADSEWSEYYSLGRWTVLTWSLANSSRGSDAAWKEVQDISDELLKRFGRRPADEQQAQLAIMALTRLSLMISAMPNDPDSSEAKALMRRLEMTMQQLFS